MQTIYRPGRWHLIVIPGALVALPSDIPGDVVARLWERLPGEKSLATVVDVLTAHAGGSFTALPPFAAAVAEGEDVRIALRGGVAARVSSRTDAAQELSGAEVTTWSERFVGGATRVEITVEQTDAVAELPVQSGVVLAAAVSAELEPNDAEPLDGLGPVPVLATPSGDGAPSAASTGQKAPALALFGAAAAVVPGVAVPSGPAVPGVIADVPAPAGDDAAPVADVPEVADVAADAEPLPVEVPSQPSSDESAPVESSPDEPSADVGQPADVVPSAPEPPVVTEPEVLDGSEVAAESAPSEPVADATAEESLPGLPDDGMTLVPSEATLGPLSDSDEFDQLFGATVHTPSVFDAPPPPPAPAFGEGDHDGATISAAELRSLRQNPPVANDAPTQVIPVADAGAGRIRLSTGQVVALDRTVIIGRRPRSTRASGENLPHLVAVESPQQDISRSHLEVRPEGDTVVVIDLHTTNGSTLLRPGADPVRLHPGEQTLVLSGDVVDLGDGVTLAFEDLP